ncbi:MAG: SH3 domain-containing protein [Devosia sp.]
MTLRTLGAATLVTAGSLLMLASAASASQAIMLNTVSMHAGPVDKSSAMGTLKQGTKVSVVWCGPEVKFCLVRFHELTGWVLSTDLTAAGASKAVDEEGGKGTQAADSSGGGRTPKQASALVDMAPPKAPPPSGPVYSVVTGGQYGLINP